MYSKKGNLKMKITFLPQNIITDAACGENLLQVAARAGVLIDGHCAGKGTCGKCKVKRIQDNGGDAVLACQTEVREDMTVEVFDLKTTAQRKTQLMHLPEDFVIETELENHYGVAVDMGTTTVVMMLWNLHTGELVDVDAITNPQSAYGADVISRIAFTMEASFHLKLLQKLMIDCINKSVEKMALNKNIAVLDIRKYVVVGNTTMSHIFLGYDLEDLATAPFLPAYKKGISMPAESLGLKGMDCAEVYVAANIAGHVGADITAGILTTEMLDRHEPQLFIDIGTNGEIVLTGNDRMVACSTAAGPAFEGRSVSQGMRAAKGAIEHVKVDDSGIRLDVIGDGIPAGICGSGLIDAVSEFLQAGMIDCTGRILSREEFKAKGLPECLLHHIAEDGEINHIVLFFGKGDNPDIRLTQKDVREIQLAKAAIAAGMQTLMEEIGLDLDDLERISIAGAFGSYISVESAMKIGLLPRVDGSKVYAAGNTAGTGASMLLLQPSLKTKADDAAAQIEHIELAGSVTFQEKYLSAMDYSV